MSYFGRRLAALLDGPGWQVRYLETRAWQPRAALRALRQAAGADLVYLVGGQVARWSRPHLLTRAVRAPVVMHWAGTDVLHARAAVRSGHATETLLRRPTHWAGAPWLVDELAEIGVGATWQPHSWVPPTGDVPLPSGPLTALAYLPEARQRFYGVDAVCRIAAALPEVRVLVVGTRSVPNAPPNIEAVGWVDQIADVLARCHVLLRLPRHDGLSFMVQEALALGRYAIWNHPFPGAMRASTSAEAISALQRLAVQQRAQALPPNSVGAAHARERFSADRIRTELLDGFARILSR